MKVVNIHDAKTHLSKLINEVLSGQSVVIAKSGMPVVKLTAYQEQVSPRKGGQLSDILDIPENFDEPLPDDVLQAFYHEHK